MCQRHSLIATRLQPSCRDSCSATGSYRTAHATLGLAAYRLVPSGNETGTFILTKYDRCMHTVCTLCAHGMVPPGQWS